MRKRHSVFHSIVFRNHSSFVYFFAVAILAAKVGSAAQTPPQAKSAERLALQHGQTALQSGDIARARTEFEKAVRLAPNDAEAQLALGWVLAQQGEQDAAVTHLRAAIKSKPDIVEARLTLASVWRPS